MTGLKTTWVKKIDEHVRNFTSLRLEDARISSITTATSSNPSPATIHMLHLAIQFKHTVFSLVFAGT